MTKQALIEKRWRVYVNYSGAVPLPDHLGNFLSMVSSDISSVDDVDEPLPRPATDALMDRIYLVCSSLPKEPRQNLVVAWDEVEPFFKLSSETVS